MPLTSDSTVEPRTFFSAAAAFIININKGRRVTDENGVSKMVDQKVAEFNPIGDGFGKLITNDPELIEKLSARCATHGDVFEAAEYTRRTVPVEVRMEGLLAEHQRTIETNNRLLAYMAEKGITIPDGAAPPLKAPAPKK